MTDEKKKRWKDENVFFSNDSGLYEYWKLQELDEDLGMTCGLHEILTIL